MSEIKEKLINLIKDQPEDSSAEEILREIAMYNIISRRLEDSRNGNVISDEAMKARIESGWR